jgi:zinc finger SWIM domain-containing protein 3
VEAYQFAVRQLDEVMEGVQKILILKGEEAQVITSNSIQAYASESEPAEIFRNGHATEDQDVSNRVSGEIDRSATQRAQTTVNYNQMDSDRVLNVEPPPPNTVVCISSPSSPYVSTHSVAPNSLLQASFYRLFYTVAYIVVIKYSYLIQRSGNLIMLINFQRIC